MKMGTINVGGYMLSAQMREDAEKAVFKTLKEILPENAQRTDVIRYILEEIKNDAGSLHVNL